MKKEINNLNSVICLKFAVAQPQLIRLLFFFLGVEKAHAYSPTHSEIHFNDYQTFSMEDGERKTSIFYVATHEIGKLASFCCKVT